MLEKKNNFRKSGEKSKRTKSKSSEEDRAYTTSKPFEDRTEKLELNTAYNRNKTDVLGKYKY